MPGVFNYIFPPNPTFTDKDVGDLSGKVFLVTGAASGIGFELAKMLYSKNATIYIAARSSNRAGEAIKTLQTEIPKSQGRLAPLVVDLADLSSIKPAVQTFLSRETRLDCLMHNAGVMQPPTGSKTKLGHDLEMGTHCLGPFLLTTLLEDILKKTAATSKPYTVRIVWIVSILQISMPAGCMEFDDQGSPKVLPDKMANYVQSKCGETWLAAEFAQRLGGDKILSVAVHPGLVRSPLQKNMPAPARLLMSAVFKRPVFAAYTELFASLSPKLNGENNGAYIMAWGRVEDAPPEVLEGLKPRGSGGISGKAQMLLDYVERETKAYL